MELPGVIQRPRSNRVRLLRRQLGPVDVQILVVDERVRALAVFGLERLELGDRTLTRLLDQPLLDVGRQFDRIDAEIALVVELDRRVTGRARSLLVGGEEGILERGNVLEEGTG